MSCMIKQYNGNLTKFINKSVKNKERKQWAGALGAKSLQISYCLSIFMLVTIYEIKERNNYTDLKNKKSSYTINNSSRV